MDRESLGWGPAKGLHGRNHTHLACRKCAYEAPFVELAVFVGFGVLGEIVRDETCLTVDHVIPSCCGGSDEPFNLITLCRACNTRRGAYLPNPATLL